MQDILTVLGLIITAHLLILVAIIIIIKKMLMGDTVNAVNRIRQGEAEVRKKEEKMRREREEEEKEREWREGWREEWRKGEKGGGGKDKRDKTENRERIEYI